MKWLMVLYLVLRFSVKCHISDIQVVVITYLSSLGILYLFFYFDIIVDLAVYSLICLCVIINLNYLMRSAVGLVLTCFVPGLHF